MLMQCQEPGVSWFRNHADAQCVLRSTWQHMQRVLPSQESSAVKKKTRKKDMNTLLLLVYMDMAAKESRGCWLILEMRLV